jgi:hypothetical protein
VPVVSGVPVRTKQAFGNQPHLRERFTVMMRHTDTPRTLRVERPIATTPEAAWELIADITRMGDWSPETTSAEWTGGTRNPAVGARFKGTNQMGSKKWKSDCVIMAFVPGNNSHSMSRQGR